MPDLEFMPAPDGVPAADGVPAPEAAVSVPEATPMPVPAEDVARLWAWPVVGVIAALAGLAYGWGANSDGAEMYYVGAVRTMSHSWHAFLFGAYDPAGSISMDKLPGAFWVQALVVRVFGLHTWCFIAPQVAAGVGTVLVMFVAVRRLAGPRTGVLAAVITAALPATAVMSRGNTADAISVVLMVLAASPPAAYARC
jgi:4-amino-4-deoxy-L-arabinose transferase-like glycosyltransferase